MTDIHTGSWGTPDLSITEAIGKVLGSSTTAQGGSDIIPNQTQTSGPTNADWQQVWNNGYNNNGNYGVGGAWLTQAYQAGQAAYQTNKAKGAGSGGAPVVPTAPTGIPGPSQSDQDALQAQINAIYQPNADYLNQAASTIQGQQAGNIQSVNDQYTASKNTLDLNNTQAGQALDTAGAQAGSIKEDAYTAATRLYNELQRGGQQRFGGASSAGEAYNALLGVEQQRGQQATEKTYANTMSGISQKRQDVLGQYQNSLFVLDTQKNQALQTANNDFQDRMLEISKMQASNQSAKSAGYMDALQQLKSQISAINLQNTRFQQTLQLQKLAYDQQLDQAATYLQTQTNAAATSVSNFGNSVSNPTTSMNITTPTSVAYSPTGAINPTKKDDIYNLFA